MNTNGWFVAERMDDVAKLDLVCVTLDGPREVHDAQRHKGSYDRAVDALERLRGAGVPVVTMTVLTPRGIGAVDHVLDVAASMGFQGVLSARARRRHRRAPAHRAAQRRHRAWRSAARALLEKKRAGRPVGNSARLLEAHLRDRYLGSCADCYAGQYYGYVLSDGTVAPCLLTQGQVEPGNGRREGFARAFERLAAPTGPGCACVPTHAVNQVLEPEARGGLGGPAPRPRQCGRTDASGRATSTSHPCYTAGMPGPSRRELLASLASALVGCGASPTPTDDAGVDDAPSWADVPDDVDLGPSVAVRFEHGVASGDPLGDRVILWTRATPTEAPRPGDKALLRWEVSPSPDFAEVVARGNAVADARRDWTVKVDAMGLRPGGVWYFRFTSGDARSPIGRTRTAPVGAAPRLRFAVVSCASLAHGYFHVYRDIARQGRPRPRAAPRGLHLRVPLGVVRDVRPYDPPTEIVSLSDYRRRYAQYRRDPDLQAMHRQHPMAAIWDDHEFANNAWRMGTDGRPDPRFAARAEAARRAWFEWMPTREGMGERIYRRLRYGDLADVMLLDTRFDGRDAQKPFDTPRLRDPSRSILGMAQEAWLGAQLADRGPRWRVLAQQVVLSPRPIDLNVDAWDGYPAAQERLLALFRVPEVGDPVVLTGDIHTSWAFEVAPDPRDPQLRPRDGPAAPSGSSW